MSEQELYWYVIYTRPRWEKKVAALLTDCGIHNYCPLQKVLKNWSDRKKVVEEPLFKGYVFVQVSEARKWEVRDVNGVLNYIHYLGKPAKVPQEDITTIQKFLLQFSDVEVVDRSIAVNNAVTVKTGILMDYEGIVVEVNGNQARVQIDSLGLSLCASFHTGNLEKLSAIKS